MFKQFYLTNRLNPNRTITPSQNKPGSNGNEVVAHISQSYMTEASLSDWLVS